MNARLTISTLTVESHTALVVVVEVVGGVVVVHCQWWCSCDVMRMFVTVLVPGVGTVTP